MNKAVFLDRDGVINDGTLYYTYTIKDFILNEGVIEGLQLLQNAGYLLIVFTNQAGVAKGIYTEQDVSNIHAYMCAELAKHGITINGIYYCPHHSDIADCDCRKPKPGMLISAIQDFNIDTTKSFVIGDSARDIEAANAVNVQGFRIQKNESILPICKQIITHE